jgi:hypothetical protein
MPLVIRKVPLAELHQDPANVRRHPERNMRAIAASLKEFGQVEPLVVLKGTGKVLGGNGRLAAMHELGWSECDVVEVDLDGIRATSLAIALNRTAELADWDDLALVEQLRALQSDDIDLEAIGFTAAEVDRLCESLGTSILDGSDWPEVSPPESHSIVLRYRPEDAPTLLRFLGETDPKVLNDGKAGAKLLARIREVATA